VLITKETFLGKPPTVYMHCIYNVYVPVYRIQYTEVNESNSTEEIISKSFESLITFFISLFVYKAVASNVTTLCYIRYVSTG